MLAIALVVAAWRCDPRLWFRRLAVVALAAVCVQGLLGGLRVSLDEVQLAKIHGCFGPAYFALAAALAATSSRRWREAAPVAYEGAAKLRRLAIITAALAYLQLVIGAHLRHMTPNMSAAAFRAVLFFHLIVAAAVVVHAVLLGWRARGASRATGSRSRAAAVLVALVLAQVALGGATWVVKYGWPAWFVDTPLSARYTIQDGSLLQATTATAHVAVGSLIVATAVLAALWSLRYVGAGVAAGRASATEIVAALIFPAALTGGVR
jgi:cytochrome c oxidase assembly protein subunit 15